MAVAHQMVACLRRHTTPGPAARGRVGSEKVLPHQSLTNLIVIVDETACAETGALAVTGQGRVCTLEGRSIYEEEVQRI